MIDKKLLQKRFSVRAATYDRYARVQKKMAGQLMEDARRRTIEPPRRILEIGCGTGYLTERLRQRFPTAEITAVDLAPGMLEMARRRLKDDSIRWICGDIEEMELTESYDLIVSNAAFQWFNELPQTIRKLREQLDAGGSLLFSTFGESTFHEMRASFAKATRQLGVNVASPGQTFLSLSELLALCEEAVENSDLISGKESIKIETFANVRDFFTSIQKIGASNSNATGRIQRPSLLKEMMRNYEKDFRSGGQIPATYHCLFISIEKRGCK